MVLKRFKPITYEAPTVSLRRCILDYCSMYQYQPLTVTLGSTFDPFIFTLHNLITSQV